jgi:hypothetical protein
MIVGVAPRGIVTVSGLLLLLLLLLLLGNEKSNELVESFSLLTPRYLRKEGQRWKRK